MDWYIEEEKLDVSQQKIYNLPTDNSGIVKGCAGSGKTNLALWRALYIQKLESSQNFTVLIYTKALRRFIENGLLAIGLNPEKVIHYDKWNGMPVDYIIVDEAQDFPKERIENMKSKAKKAIMYFGDNAQQLYDNALKISDIKNITGLKIYDLDFNYRLPITVAKFAQYLNTNENDIISNCKNITGTTKPRVIRFNTWQEELDFIMNEIKTRNLVGTGTESTAILLPFNKKNSTGIAPSFYSVENVREYFLSKSFNVLFKEYDEVDLDFNSDLPKVMTYHSAKGLQFDTVFIPHCGENWSIYRNPMYVAVTRTSRNLIITYSDKLSVYIDSIPKNLDLYETK